MSDFKPIKCHICKEYIMNLDKAFAYQKKGKARVAHTGCYFKEKYNRK